MRPDRPTGPGLTGPLRPHGPTRREALDGVAADLEAGGVEAPRVEAERLLAAATGLDRGELQLALTARLTSDEASRLARLTSKRLSGIPLQHLEGTVEFRSLVLSADPRAFLPRPETEQLVDRVADWARGREAAEGVRRVRRPDAEPPLGTALDVGTGSGAIGLSLVHERIVGRVVALERSRAALDQATENRERIGLTDRQVELRRVSGPIWEALREDERFDVIVSNPPYVAADQLEGLPADVRRDPIEALSGGEDGLDVIRELLSEAWERLNPAGALFVEIGETQGDRVARLIAGAGEWARVEIAEDLSGRVRFAFAERPEPGYTRRSTPDADSGQ